MSRNALSGALWRTLGGVFGVAVVVSLAFAIDRFVSIAGISLT